MREHLREDSVPIDMQNASSHASFVLRPSSSPCGRKNNSALGLIVRAASSQILVVVRLRGMNGGGAGHIQNGWVQTSAPLAEFKVGPCSSNHKAGFFSFQQGQG